MFERAPVSHARTLRCVTVAVAILLITAGCTASKKMMQIAKDPSIPVGELRDQPSLVALSIVASNDMNPNVYQPVEAKASATGLPYSVSLSGNDLADLAQQLKVTLRQVHGELKAADAREGAGNTVSFDEEAPSEDVPSGNDTNDNATDAAGQAGDGIVGASDADEEESSDEDARPPDVQEHGDGVSRQVGQYRDAHEADHDDEQSAAGDRSSRNASPVDITVYQLKDDGRFLGADFDQLRDDPKKALGKTYLDHDDFVVRPGGFKFVRFFPVKEQTQFIAVVAGYQDVDSMVWKGIARIEPTGGRYPLLVSLGRHGVSIQKEE